MKYPTTLQAITFKWTIKLFTVTTLSSHSTLAQELNVYNNQQLPAKTENFYYTAEKTCKKNFWRATTEWTLVQLLPWGVDRYIRKAEFARINVKSMHHNYKISNWEWDDNKFFNNQFSHPFHGSLYFNSFRSNGYNFWESIAPVFAGTYVWETIMEKHVPAPNDLINTSLGGIVIGEMTAHLSKLLLVSRKNKRKTSLKDPLAMIINPMQAANRIADKTWGKTIAPSHDPAFTFSMLTEAGVREGTARTNDIISKKQQELYGRLTIQYGDPYSNCKAPFSNFFVLVEIGNSDTGKLNTLQIEGAIYGRKIKQTENQKHAFNISMNYDYLQNSLFVYGAQSVRTNFLSQIKLNRHIQIGLKASTGIILLAAVPNTYMYYGEGRNYDYCSGISLQAGIEVNIANRLFINYRSNAAQTTTINGYHGSHLLQDRASEVRINIIKNVSVNLSSNSYFFNGYYQKLSNIHEHHIFRYAGVGYKVNL